MTAGAESVMRQRARLATTTPVPRDRAPLFDVAGAVECPPTVTAVIPTLNEAANIAHVIGRIPEWVEEIIVIDGDSSDDTCEMAKAAA